MTRLLAHYQFLVDHPVEALGVLMVALAFAYVLGALLFAVWAASEERRQEQERDRFDRIMAASTPPRAPGMGTTRKRIS